MKQRSVWVYVSVVALLHALGGLLLLSGSRSEWAAAPFMLSWLLTFPFGVVAQALEVAVAFDSRVGIACTFLVGLAAFSAAAWLQGTCACCCLARVLRPEHQTGNGAVV